MLAITTLDLDFTLNIIKIVAIVGALLGVAWKLSKQLEEMRNQIKNQTALFTVKLELVEKQIENTSLLVGDRVDRIKDDLGKVQEDVKQTGTARNELWKEINSLRERAKALEVQPKES